MAAGTSALLALVGGGFAGVSALTRDGGKQLIVTEAGRAAAAAPRAPEPGVSPGPSWGGAARPHADALLRRDDEPDKADRTGTRTPRRPSDGPSAATPAPAPTTTVAPLAAGAPALPLVTTSTQVETREIPYETRLVRDPQLPRGARKIEVPGTPGIETLRYLVTLTDGRQTDRKLIDAVVTRQPQHRVVAFGTRGGPLGTRGGPQRHDRNCGEALNFCVPLGRSALCSPNEGLAHEDPAHQGRPDEGVPEDRRTPGAGTPVPGDDDRTEDTTDLVLDAGALSYLEELAC